MFHFFYTYIMLNNLLSNTSTLGYFNNVKNFYKNQQCLFYRKSVQNGIFKTKKADGIDFLYITCFSIIPAPTKLQHHNLISVEVY